MPSRGELEPKAQTVGAYPGFISMKHPGVLLLPPPPGRDAGPSQGYPLALCASTQLCTWSQLNKRWVLLFTG